MTVELMLGDPVRVIGAPGYADFYGTLVGLSGPRTGKAVVRDHEYGEAHVVPRTAVHHTVYVREG